MKKNPNMWSSLLEEVEIMRKLRWLKIYYDPEKCTGAWQCYEVCPVGCWTPDRDSRKVIFHDAEKCIACGACVLQCPSSAIELK